MKMPFKHSEKKIPTKLKKSAKLSKEEKDEMKRMYELGGWSYNTLGKEFGVSKRTAYFAVNPDKLIENYQKRVERGGSKIYYDKEKNTVFKRNHRKYKQELYLKGVLE